MDIALNLSTLDWNSELSSLHINPRLDKKTIESLSKAVSSHSQSSCLWVLSSGTESTKLGQYKLVCLEKRSFLVAAKSFNEFYQCTQKDVWLNPLPLFHVGGLSILARSYHSKSKVTYLQSWNVESFINGIFNSHVTLASLVPTQVYDLVKENTKAPKSLRLVFVGGGALDLSLYKKARLLGWPLIPSYGMTETCAMLAGARIEDLTNKESFQMHLLPHVSLKKDNRKFVLSSESLFKGYLFVNDKQVSWEPRAEAYILDDHLELEDGRLRVLGRQSELIKVLGESVNLNQLKHKIKKELDTNQELHLTTEPDERRGHQLILWVEGLENNISIDELNKVLMPFERIESVHRVKEFPRTSLGKVIAHQLKLLK